MVYILLLTANIRKKNDKTIQKSRIVLPKIVFLRKNYFFLIDFMIGMIHVHHFFSIKKREDHLAFSL